MNAQAAKAPKADKSAKAVRSTPKPAKAPKAEKAARAAKDKPKAGKADGARTSPYAAERLMTLILAPVISEKATQIVEKYDRQQYVFRVTHDATKPQVKAAVELMWKVEVAGVQISNVGGKQKRFGQYMGKRRSWKKAYVSLKPGNEIQFAQEA
jgi:large subunit ribosomal protein L23